MLPQTQPLAARAQLAKESAVDVERGGQPVGTVNDGDAFIYYDFRADRAVEIATAFTQKDFDKFDRGELPDIYFAALTEYDSDKSIPENILVPPVEISSPLNTFWPKIKFHNLLFLKPLNSVISRTTLMGIVIKSRRRRTNRDRF